MNDSETPLGTHDAFKNAAAWNSETSQTWVAALNLRSTSTDQIALRTQLVNLGNLKDGDIISSQTSIIIFVSALA